MRKLHYEEIIFDRKLDLRFSRDIIHSSSSFYQKLLILGNHFKIQNSTKLALIQEYKTTGKRSLQQKILEINRTGIIDHHFMAVLATFHFDKPKVHRIGKQFAEALYKADLKIHEKYLPDANKIYCIEFPKGMRFKINGQYCHCIYAFIANEFLPVIDANIKYYLQISIPAYDVNGELEKSDTILTIPFNIYKDQDIEYSIDKLRQSNRHISGAIELFEFALKCMVYIESGNPDLRAGRKPNTNNPKKLRQQLAADDTVSLVDTVLVGYEHKKNRIYSVGATTVPGFFRWQPYGQGRNQIKLIWIDDFEKQYKKPTSNP